MDWEQLYETGRVWRVRAALEDRPGALAKLATRLSERGCNLLEVAVHPVSAGIADSGGGNVIDEFVLRTPDGMGVDDLVALVSAEGVSCVGVAPAAVKDLVDGETAVLRAALAVLAGTSTLSEVLRRLLVADSVTPEQRPPAGPAVSGDGRRLRVRVPGGGALVLTRGWAPFTDGEVSRVSALVELVAAQPAPPAPTTPQAPTPPAASPPRPVRQLSSLDVQFLNAESDTTALHVGSLTVLDPSGLAGGAVTVESLRALFRSRLHLVAPLRWRLREVPLGLDRPYWEDCDDVDLDHHVREIVLLDGTAADLNRLVATLAAVKLDRTRPLWECYLVSGLAGGGQALYTKVHHAVIDGVSGAEVMAAVLDLTPEPFQVPPPDGSEPRTRAPRPAEVARGCVRNAAARPVRVARSLPGVLPHLLDVPGVAAVPGATAMGAAVGAAARVLRRGQRPALAPRPGVPPKAPFTGKVGKERAFAAASLPLAEVKTVKNALGLTVNDVVMALCTSAVRTWLLDHDALPGKPIIASMPVSVRTPEQLGTAGNQISFMATHLPTHLEDPAARVRQLQHGLASAKARFAAAPPRLLHEVSEVLPQVFGGRLARFALRAATASTPPFNLLVSNVPGPQLPLYAAGARVTRNYPVSVVSDYTGGVNITVMSYDGHLDFGVIACPAMVPDVEVFPGHLRAALDELLRAATAPARPEVVPADR